MNERNDSELTIQQIINILLKRWLILLIVPIVAASIAGIYLKLNYVPTYKSNATLYIVGAQKNQALSQTDLTLGTMLIKDYQQLIKTNLIIDEVLSRLPNEGLTFADIVKSINVATLKDTRILNISVTSPDARQSALIANMLSDVFIEKIKEIMRVDSAKPIDAAEVALTPLSSNLTRNVALVAIVALMIAIGILLLLEMLDTTIKTEDDINKRLGLTVLGKIPSFLGGKDDKKNTNIPLIKAYSVMEGYVREAVKTLRTNILYSGIDNDINAIAITSTTPSEGKTSNAVFLAIAMAELGKRVCIVDCDLRRPMVCRQFGIQQHPGVTDIVTGRTTLEEAILSTRIANLSIIDAGHKLPNPAEALNSKRFATLVEEINAQFDFVIYDTPPLAAFIDAALIGLHTDGVLVLIDQGKIRTANVLEAVEQLKRVNVPILGAILNHIGTNGPGAGHYLKYYNEYNTQKHAKIA